LGTSNDLQVSLRLLFCSADRLGGQTHDLRHEYSGVEGFAATAKRWLLHITGGEPSIYPGFVELCDKLTRLHYLSINSNLSHRCMDTFAERINPERVRFINAALLITRGRIGHRLMLL
jgi:MoaA/NifB/PqqE/SkfB family radical SAM enzyme